MNETSPRRLYHPRRLLGGYDLRLVADQLLAIRESVTESVWKSVHCHTGTGTGRHRTDACVYGHVYVCCVAMV